MPIDFIRRGLGLDLESQAENYTDRLTDTRSGIKRWGAGDMFTDMFAEGTREEVEQRARELVEKEINTGSTGTRKNITESLGNTSVDLSGLKIQEGETETEYNARLEGLQAAGQVNLNNTNTIDGYDPTRLKEGTVGAASTLGSTTRTENKDKPGGINYITEQNENRLEIEDRRYESQLARQQYNEDRDEAWRRSQSEREDKRYDMQMQLAQLDRADKREDRRIAREDRQADKRQASIMMLIKGLTQLGAGFSI